MNSRTVSIATLACALIGCWLPSWWLPVPAQKGRSILLPTAAREPAWKSLQAKVRGAGSSMKQFQAVMAGVRGHGAGIAFHVEDTGDLLCEEAEELAARLAGEELGAHVTDGPAFMKSLRECDYNVKEAALEAWAEADPDAALQALIATANDFWGTQDTLIQRIAARDPDKALAMLRAAPAQPVSSQSSQGRMDVWNAVLAACVEKGTDYALAAIQSAPREAQESGMHSLLSAMAAKDPRAALAWSDALPPELKELTDNSTIFETWSESDPATALKTWMEMPDLPQKSIGQDLATKWAAKDPEAFIQWANAQGERAGEFVRIAALAMAHIDPRRAAAMASELPSGAQVPNEPDSPLADPFANNAGRDVRWAIGQEWVQKDPAGALAWALSLPAVERSYVINGLRPHLTDLPVEELRTAAHQLGTETSAGFLLLWDVDRDEAGKAFAAQTAEQKLRNFSALSYSVMAESPAVAAGLLQGVIKEFADAPADASRNLDSGDSLRNAATSTSRDLSRYVAEVTSTWAGRDPAAAAAWVRQLPPGDSQAIAAANIAITWGRYDLPAAKAWVEQLPAGPARDKASEQISSLVSASGE